MKRVLVAAVIGGSLVSCQAYAQERAGSAAVGAVSGAVVLGPVGAVAGAFIAIARGTRGTIRHRDGTTGCRQCCAVAGGQTQGGGRQQRRRATPGSGI
jgi:hypothetical protein